MGACLMLITPPFSAEGEGTFFSPVLSSFLKSFKRTGLTCAGCMWCNIQHEAALTAACNTYMCLLAQEDTSEFLNGLLTALEHIMIYQAGGAAKFDARSKVLPLQLFTKYPHCAGVTAQIFPLEP